jgi:hypothetical protein
LGEIGHGDDSFFESALAIQQNEAVVIREKRMIQ